MELAEHLSAFSVEDLRELARRRGIPLHQESLRSRQALVRHLSWALTGWGAVQAALGGLTAAQTDALVVLLHLGPQAGLTRLAEAGRVSPVVAKGLLEELRRSGFVFPRGDWEHPVFPGGSAATLRSALSGFTSTLPRVEAIRAEPPALAVARGPVAPRPGRLAADLAEFLARVARARLKVTQAQRLNRRDLRAMESGLAVQAAGYSEFLFVLAAAGRFLGVGNDDQPVVMSAAEHWLALPEVEGARVFLDRWLDLAAFPESADREPWEETYVPPQQGLHRRRLLAMLTELGQPAAAASLAARLRWEAPASFRGPAGRAEAAVARLLRSLFWLGVVGLDHPTAPTSAGLTPLGQCLLEGRTPDQVGLIPLEPQFILQPTAEAFAPPNLAPRTLFHLRRLTGEKKGAPAGLFPIAPDTVRRALDSGLNAGAILAFLETHSRTGLPANIRKLVEDVARNHGRIRLVPTEFVLVTDTPELSREIAAAAPLAQLLGARLTDGAVGVPARHAPELLRRLRQRGYSPVDESLSHDVPPLPPDPAAPTPPLAPRDADAGLDWAAVEAGGPDESGPRLVDLTEIRSLLCEAEAAGLAVEMEYSPERGTPEVRVVEPVFVGAQEVEAFCRRAGAEHSFLIRGIRWARLAGGAAHGL